MLDMAVNFNIHPTLCRFMTNVFDIRSYEQFVGLFMPTTSWLDDIVEPWANVQDDTFLANFSVDRPISCFLRLQAARLRHAWEAGQVVSAGHPGRAE